MTGGAGLTAGDRSLGAADDVPGRLLGDIRAHQRDHYGHRLVQADHRRGAARLDQILDAGWTWTDQPERVSGVDRVGGEGDDRVQRRSGSSRCPGQTANVRRSQCMTSRHATLAGRRRSCWTRRAGSRYVTAPGSPARTAPVSRSPMGRGGATPPRRKQPPARTGRCALGPVLRLGQVGGRPPGGGVGGVCGA